MGTRVPPRAPYGFRVEDGEVVPDEGEQKIVELTRQLHGRGKSLREIGAELDEKGFRPRDGTDWHPHTVRRIVIKAQPPSRSSRSVANKGSER